jgi:hypothetical protein
VNIIFAIESIMTAIRQLIVFLLPTWLLPGLFLNMNAQDTLPQFSVKDIGGNRYVISWVNNYTYTAQITIQRSFDSIRGYKSILTVPDPAAKQNGYADAKAINDHMFYRLYIQLENGRYLFTAAKQPTREVIVPAPPATGTLAQASIPTKPKDEKILPTTQPVTISATKTPEPVGQSALQKNEDKTNEIKKNTEELVPDTPSTTSYSIPAIKRAEPVVYRLQNIRLGDSAKTPTAVFTKDDPNAYAPSLFVFTHPDGNIRVQVPNRARLARYRIKFFESDKRLLFELKNLPAPEFQVDKTNFLHGGWFLFELYEDNRLLEKHKLYLDR